MTSRDWLFKTARQFADMVPRPAFDAVAGHFGNFARLSRLSHHQPLGFNNLMPNVGWLWPSFLWPFFAIFILALWAAVLRRRNQRA